PFEPILTAMLELIGFDGDDTLWHSEGYYQQARTDFAAIVTAHADIDAATLQQQLDRHTEAMLGLYGYGAKGLTLAMVQTAIDASAARIDSSAIARILALGRNILQHPVQLLPGM